MVVVLCESYYKAKEAFKQYLTFMLENEPFAVREVYDASLCLERDDDLRFIFVDYRYKDAFNHMQPDVLTLDEVFKIEGVDEYFGYVL
jgi:hypothetical protein